MNLNVLRVLFMEIFRISEILSQHINSHRNKSINEYRGHVTKIMEYDARIKECKKLAFDLYKAGLISEDNLKILNIL